LKESTSDPIARRLAALALDELHSDAGDAVIKNVADMSDDIGLQTLCQALLVKKHKQLVIKIIVSQCYRVCQRHFVLYFKIVSNQYNNDRGE